jgi:Ca-activated chloride channel family protein
VIEWLWPWVFFLLPLPFVATRLLGPIASRDVALRVPNAEAFRDLAPARSARAPRRSSRFLLWCAWIALLVAAARPQLIGPPTDLPVSGRDLLLAVDISGSMNTEDMLLDGQPVDRLTVVKRVAREFIERRRGDRVGLVLFGSNAYLQAPLTFDLATLAALLEETPIGIAGGKTAIGDAIGLSVKRLRDRPADARVLILLTDGANNVGEVLPLKAAELAAIAGVRIHTIGVGAESMRVPGFFRDRVVNPSADLDEPTLRAIAERTGGRYFRARDTAELESIYRLIDALEPIEQGARTFRPIRVLYHWPLAAACALAALLLIAGSRRRVAA